MAPLSLRRAQSANALGVVLASVGLARQAFATFAPNRIAKPKSLFIHFQKATNGQ